MSITRSQAEDLIDANYLGDWADADPEWWEDMIAMLMEYRSVKHLRREDTSFGWRVPPQWPGAVKP